MQIGKKNTYIHVTNVALNRNTSFIIDTFRKMFGKYWIADRRGVRYANDNYAKAMESEAGIKVYFGSTTTMNLINAPFCSKIQEVYLQGDKEKWDKMSPVLASRAETARRRRIAEPRIARVRRGRAALELAIEQDRQSGRAALELALEQDRQVFEAEHNDARRAAALDGVWYDPAWNPLPCMRWRLSYLEHIGAVGPLDCLDDGVPLASGLTAGNHVRDHGTALARLALHDERAADDLARYDATNALRAEEMLAGYTRLATIAANRASARLDDLPHIDIWERVIRKIIPKRNPLVRSGRFMDMSFVIDTPLNRREAEMFGDTPGLGYFNIDFEYNFYVAQFEKTIESVPEELLPNIYAFISEQAAKPSKNMRNLLTFNGMLSRKQASLPKPSTRRDEGTYARQKIRSYHYYLKASNAITRMGAQRIQQFSKLYRNYIFPFENLDIVSDISLKTQFPMYAEVEFSTDRTTTVAQILEDASLSTSLLRHAAAATERNDFFSKRFLGGSKHQLLKSSEIMMPQGSANRTTSSRGGYETIDLLAWWKNYLNGSIPKTVFGEQTLVGPKSLSIYVSSGVDNNNLSQAIHCLIFAGKLKETIKSNLRSFEEIWNGKTNPTETVLYCVEKYDTAARSIIQRYWFPNSNTIDVIKFVDTQVKYGKQYTYSVFAYQLAFSEEYAYGPLEISPDRPHVTVYKPCPDFPFPSLEGSQCSQDVGLEFLACVERDAQKLITIVYPGLGVDTTNVESIAEATVEAYVAVGQAWAFFSGVYAIQLVWSLQQALFPSAYESEAVGGGVGTQEEIINALLDAIRNYRMGHPDGAPSPPLGPQVEWAHSEYRARTIVTTYPCIKLVKVPYFTRTGYMIDDPPVFPDVNIVPYKSRNDKLLIWLNMNVGDYQFYPVALNDEEQTMINNLRQKNLLKPSEPIRYKTDDYIREFQIFRMLEKPESYTDFANSERAKISTNTIKKVNGNMFSNFKASSASYLDGVTPNTKYYYMFRAVDTHGHISYPSPVYEVELLDNDGAVYPIINIISVEQKPESFDTTKAVKRYVHIAPRITQGLFNMEASGLDDGSITGEISKSATAASSYVLGVENETLWGKKFKVRFISKSTGRKIDLNITYEKKHVVSPEQVEIQQQGVIDAISQEIAAARNFISTSRRPAPPASQDVGVGELDLLGDGGAEIERTYTRGEGRAGFIARRRALRAARAEAAAAGDDEDDIIMDLL